MRPRRTQTFNRTSMELKRHRKSVFACLTESFNRTSMELKREVWGAMGATLSLLIEPVWN